MKATQKTTREELKRQELKKTFAAITTEELNGIERMQIAIQLGVSIRTVERYLAGEVKKVAFGERLSAAIKAFMASAKTASAA